jgi:hypothetical protein
VSHSQRKTTPETIFAPSLINRWTVIMTFNSNVDKYFFDTTSCIDTDYL